MISRVLLENWRSHRLSELHFEKGTNVFVGIAGSGKTSVMDAVCFALFGTFPALQSRKVSLDEIVMAKPNKMQKARIELEFDFAGKNYLVERSVFSDSKANQARLLENGKLKAGPKPTEVTQEIERILEIDFELFSRAIYSEQNHIDFFLRLSPQERKKKFDELLELDKYENVRQNAVQILNSLKKTAMERKRDFESLKEKFDNKELSEVIEKIALKEKQLAKLAKQVKEQALEIESLEKQVKELQERKQKFDALQAELLKSSGKLEELEQSSDSLSRELEGFEIKEREEQELKARKNALKERLSRLNENRKAVEKLSSEIEVLNSKKKIFESEVKAKRQVEPRSLEEVKSEELKNFDLLQNLSGETAELEQRMAELNSEKGRIETAHYDQKNFIQELNSLGANTACPTCKKPLEERHKQELLEEASARLSSWEKQLSTNASNLMNLEARRKDLKQRIELAEEAKKTLEKSRNLLQEVQENLEKIKAIDEEIISKQNVLQARQSEFSEQESELIEKEDRMLEKAIELAVKKKSIADLKERVKGFEKELKELSFKHEALEQAGEKLVEKKADLRNSESENNSLKESIGEFNKRLKDLTAIQKQVDSLQQEASSALFFSEKLGIFVNALQSTQGELRMHLIQAVNSAMQDVWPRVYPYKDFLSARIEIVEGNYELMAQARSGKWQRVEGLLSGGERMAAAITIRVAFSLVLAQQLSWLILDEPTHNLDSNSVKVLGSMLKEHLPMLVEQVFVITHDKQLENAASSIVFEMLRDKDEDAATQVVNKAI